MTVQCQKCGKEPGTEIWSDGTVAYVHGFYARWCRRCVLTEQLTHARKMAAEIPQLEAALTHLSAAMDQPQGGIRVLRTVESARHE